MPLFADFFSAQAPAVVKADGFGGVIRYASHQAGKCLTAAEAASYRAAGLEVLLVFEDGATNALGGYSQGQTDATFANQIADQIGYPTSCPIFYAVDFDAQPSQMATVDAYFEGVLSIRRRPSGPYGGINQINQVMAAGLGAYAWQTLAWSGGQISNRAVLYQSALGTTFDIDQQLGFVPAWGAAPIPPPQPPGSPPVSQLARPVIAVVQRPQNDGYWIVCQDGGIFSIGAAPNFAAHNPLPGTLKPGRLIVDADCTETGNGLVLVGSDGGIFNFGDSAYHGSIPQMGIAPSTQPLST